LISQQWKISFLSEIEQISQIVMSKVAVGDDINVDDIIVVINQLTIQIYLQIQI
jgi:hypothetical protein